jgi:hypothetical protein
MMWPAWWHHVPVAEEVGPLVVADLMRQKATFTYRHYKGNGSYTNLIMISFPRSEDVTFTGSLHRAYIEWVEHNVKRLTVTKPDYE